MTKRADNPTAPNANTLWARFLVDELGRCGVQTVCISPGSRSTPLVVAFAEDERIDDLSIIDERSAAFFALGCARATGRPVALVCTSGTAAANFFPAVCEASSDGVPLIVLTADRPPRLQDCGASQAMDQTRLYGPRVRWFHQLGQAEASPDKLRYVRATACRAYAEATGPNPGPVHLNIPFRKPLEPVEVPGDHRDAVELSVHDAPLAMAGRADGAPFVDIRRGRVAATPSTVESFAEALSNSRRPVILAGADWRGADYASPLLECARKFRIPVIAEPTSGITSVTPASAQVIRAGDLLFESRFYDALGDPDLVVRTGKAPLSWAARGRAESWRDITQTTIGPHTRVADPARVVGRHIVADEALFFEELATIDIDGAFLPAREQWMELHQAAQSRALEVVGRAVDAQCGASVRWGRELGAPHMWALIGDSLESVANLFVSSSMPIRDVDTFMSENEGVQILANRGLNGIDGVISTGLAMARQRSEEQSGPTVIVVGDVALRHDVGALRLARQLEIDATVVVIDNDGGAIFEYLPIADFEEVHERHFATSGRRSSAAGVDSTLWLRPEGAEQFCAMLQESMASTGTQIIHVNTDRHLDIRAREELRSLGAEGIDEMITSREIYD